MAQQLKNTSAIEKDYAELVKKHSGKSKHSVMLVKAFLFGGGICAFGQGLINMYEYLGFNAADSSMLCSVTLIFISAMLTGLKVYDKIAMHAGAGTLIPVTGFANSVVAPALEFKSEGWILGVSPKIFVVAGPVLVWGLLTSVICGLIRHLLEIYFLR
jgi:stage V sporulation protein AC